MLALILILLSSLFPADIKLSDFISKDTEPFYDYKQDKIFIVNKINVSPTIDGVLNEDCWKSLNQSGAEGNYIDDFTQDYPKNLLNPSFRTIVSIGSDSKYIYIGARLLDSDPDSIMQRLSRRDGIDPWLSDWFSIELDSNHDHESAYRFAVNASGVQLDGMIYGDSEFDVEYSAVWESAVQIDEYGWKLEMKIPFNMLSITQIENPWGLNINRFIFRYGEMNRWVVLEEGLAGRVSQFGHIIGFKEVQIKRGVEFKPYLLSGHNRYDNSFLTDPERFSNIHYNNSLDSINTNIGLDMKYRLSASSSFDLTINPDFGQIEMDPEYINLTYYEIEQPEKRSLFNQTESMFDLPIGIFYSRRIGESNDYNDSEYRINTALKFMGDTKKGWRYATILAQTSPRKGSPDYHDYSLFQKEYAINRITKSFLDGNSKIGISHTYWSLNRGNIINESYSIDHISKFLSNQLFIDYQLSRSVNHFNPGKLGPIILECASGHSCPDIIGNGYALSMGYQSSFPLSFTIDIENYDKNFDINKIGYLPRNNIREYQLNLGYRILEPISFIREIELNLINSQSENYDDLKIGDRIGIESIIESENYSYIRFSHYMDKEHYNDYLTYDWEVNKIGLPFRLPQSTQSAIKFLSDRRKNISFSIGFEYKESSIHKNNVFNSDDNYVGFDFELNSKVNFLSIRHIRFYYENQKINQAYGFVELIEYENVDDNDESFISYHNIFSNKRGWLDRYSITLEEYFSNKISLQIYCEYLQRFEEYSNYTELKNGNRWPTVTSAITGLDTTYIEVVEFIPQEVHIVVHPIYSDGTSEPFYDEEEEVLFQDVNPNYYVGFYPKYTNLNLNFSFKWEYNPGSDIYVIYRLTKSVNGKIFSTINDFLMHKSDDIWSERHFDVSFYIKFNYWFNI